MSSHVLVQVERGTLVESIHRGHIAVVNADGRLVAWSGNVDQVIFARSSMKPLQAIPLVESGAADHFVFDDTDLALACASHNGEPMHTERVSAILERLGLDETALQCGQHNPHHEPTFVELIRSGKPCTPIYNNCSGKHAGMLATAVHNQESIRDYYLLEHPVQQRILSVISELTQVAPAEIQVGTDGCGVPVHGVPIKNLALAFAKMAHPQQLPPGRREAVERITKAMMKAPEMVGGTGRFCTALMKTMNGKMFGKAGAEGVYCIGDRQTGLGIAVKIEDGAGRASSAVAMEVLRQLQLIEEAELAQMASFHVPPVLNARKEQIGRLRPVFSLQSQAE